MTCHESYGFMRFSSLASQLLMLPKNCSQNFIGSWQSLGGNRWLTHWASLLRWIWSISEFNLKTRDSPKRTLKSGRVHHKSRPQNMCLTHSWPQQGHATRTVPTFYNIASIKCPRSLAYMLGKTKPWSISLLQKNQVRIWASAGTFAYWKESWAVIDRIWS